MIYLNSDGSRAAFCGNAALCAVRLATRLGIVSTAEFGFETDYGLVRGRLHTQGNPEVELPAVTGFQAVYDMPLAPGELRAGLGTAGVPHLVILCADAERVDLSQRGPFLRRLAALGPEGANVNFISAASDAVDSGWRMRTYERGVEGETMACGSGAVVSALLARSWSGETVAGTASSREVVIHTSAGLPLVVRPLGGTQASGSTSSGGIALRGEGRLVFEGHLRDY
jgi:diaminopimelate epimerase